jgi:hypothetical protein
MMTTTPRRINRRQHGFAGVVFLVVALIGIIMAAIAAMSRNNAVGAPEQSARTNASVILKHAADLRTGFDRMRIDGISAAAITFDSGATGLFGTATGTTYAIRPVPPPQVATNGTPAFTYNGSVILPNVGTAAADAVFTVGNLTGDVCRQINRILYNDVATLTPASSSGELAAWTTSPAPINDGGSTATNYDTRSEGCIAAATGGQFVYYKAAVEN